MTVHDAAHSPLSHRTVRTIRRGPRVAVARARRAKGSAREDARAKGSAKGRARAYSTCLRVSRYNDDRARSTVHARFHLWVVLERLGILLHRRRVRGGGGGAIARGGPLRDERPVRFDVRHRGLGAGDAEEEEEEERERAHSSRSRASRSAATTGVVDAPRARARGEDSRGVHAFARCRVESTRTRASARARGVGDMREDDSERGGRDAERGGRRRRVRHARARDATFAR